MKLLRVLLLSSVAAICGIAPAPAQSPAPASSGQIGRNTGAQGGLVGQPDQYSPTPDAMQAAQELVALMGNDRVSDAYWPAVERLLRGVNPPLDQATLAELRGELQRKQAELVRQFTQDLPAIYARYLTLQEMRELAAFYRTPIGIKLRSVMPRIEQDVVAATTSDLLVLHSELQQTFNTVLRQHGYLR